MSRRAQRRPALYPPERDELLRKAHALWAATCQTMRHLRTSGSDYQTASELAAALCSFANDISGGATDFAMMTSTRGGGDEQGWLGQDGALEESVDEAIALCGGDPREVIRSLLVLTDFLEAEGKT